MTDLPTLQAALLARSPAAARRVAYAGDGAEVFETAHLRRNPHAARVDEAAEALVVEDSARLAEALPALAADGVAAAWIPPTDLAGLQRVLATAAEAGLEALQLQRPSAGVYFDDFATNLLAAPTAEAAASGLVLTARRARPDAPAPLCVCSVTFAPTLMDIRTRLPSHGLRSEPELTLTFGKSPVQAPALPPDRPKIQILQRPGLRDLAVWRNAMTRAVREGWITVMEYDDHPALVNEVTGRQMSDADWLRFGCVHAVQTSTRQLGEAFGAYNPQTRVFANSVFELPPFPDAPPRRIFYGGVSRGPFAADTVRALAPALAEFPDAAVFVVGDKAVFEALPTANKRFFDFMPYDDYLRLMGTCSISLSPIEGRAHQDTKSDAKFLDAASRGVLTIASPTIYADTIRHGETGLIARSPEHWAVLLAGVLRDEGERRRMARAAWEEVRERRMFADQVRVRRDWYRSLWDGRAELNAALAERLDRLPV